MANALVIWCIAIIASTICTSKVDECLPFSYTSRTSAIFKVCLKSTHDCCTRVSLVFSRYKDIVHTTVVCECHLYVTSGSSEYKLKIIYGAPVRMQSRISFKVTFVTFGWHYFLYRPLPCKRRCPQLLLSLNKIEQITNGLPLNKTQLQSKSSISKNVVQLFFWI